MHRLSALLLGVLMLISLAVSVCERSRFIISTGYDFFGDAGDMCFYQKGNQYGFVYFNGETEGLPSFTLSGMIKELLHPDTVLVENGIATFSMYTDAGKSYAGFMDLLGNVHFDQSWGNITTFSSTGYAVVDYMDGNYYAGSVILDKNGAVVKSGDGAWYSQYNFNPDIFIGDASGYSSNSDYYVLDKNLDVILSGLQICVPSDPNSADAQDFVIFGNATQFFYKKNGIYYLYDLERKRTVLQCDTEALLHEVDGDFWAQCWNEYYILKYPGVTDSVNGVGLDWVEPQVADDQPFDMKAYYNIINIDNNGILLSLPHDIESLTFGKRKILVGRSRSTGKTAVIYDKDFPLDPALVSVVSEN